MKRSLTTMLAAATALTAGCAFMGPEKIPAGTPAADLQSRFGPPTGEYPLPGGGKRLEYARGPYGKQTWMFDLDAGGRLAKTSQVLTEANFNSVKAGITGDELLRKLGRPSERRHGGFQGGEVWSWRYESVFCQWFQVSVNDEGKVWGPAYGPDPLCEKDRFFSRKLSLLTTVPLT